MKRMEPIAEELRAYSLAVINTLKELIPLNPLYSEELKFFLNRFNTHDPSPLADFAASLTTASKDELQEILATAPVLERLKKVIVLIKKELEVAKLQTQIRKQVEEKMSEHQRKFFLREQLKAIQQELGIAKDDRTADVDRFRERLDAAGARSGAETDQRGVGQAVHSGRPARRNTPSPAIIWMQ
jgi:ATP-dependent Lon protease